MKDQELRDLYSYFKQIDFAELKSTVSFIQNEIYSEHELTTSASAYTGRKTLLGKVNELIKTQQLIIEYLGIQRVDEPAKSYYDTIQNIKGKPEKE